MAQAEEWLANRSIADAAELGEEYTGDGVFAFATFAKVEVAFEEHFGKKMPVSAVGETAVHRALGFDHSGRVDVALNPDQPEGVWLLEYLKQAHIPYFAFRHAGAGQSYRRPHSHRTRQHAAGCRRLNNLHPWSIQNCPS